MITVSIQEILKLVIKVELGIELQQPSRNSQFGLVLRTLSSLEKPTIGVILNRIDKRNQLASLFFIGFDMEN